MPLYIVQETKPLNGGWFVSLRFPVSHQDSSIVWMNVEGRRGKNNKTMMSIIIFVNENFGCRHHRDESTRITPERWFLTGIKVCGSMCQLRKFYFIVSSEPFLGILDPIFTINLLLWQENKILVVYLWAHYQSSEFDCWYLRVQNHHTPTPRTKRPQHYGSSAIYLHRYDVVFCTTNLEGLQQRSFTWVLPYPCV